VDAEDAQTPISDEVYYIVQENVRNVKDFMMSLSARSMSSRLLYSDDEHVETEETLLDKAFFAQRLETEVER
jgi:hypothetical protein